MTTIWMESLAVMVALIAIGRTWKAEVAAHAGFLDQSQFTHHFKHLVGVTPGQVQTPARIA